MLVCGGAAGIGRAIVATLAAAQLGALVLDAEMVDAGLGDTSRVQLAETLHVNVTVPVTQAQTALLAAAAQDGPRARTGRRGGVNRRLVRAARH